MPLSLHSTSLLFEQSLSELAIGWRLVKGKAPVAVIHCELKTVSFTPSLCTEEPILYRLDGIVRNRIPLFPNLNSSPFPKKLCSLYVFRIIDSFEQEIPTSHSDDPLPGNDSIQSLHTPEEASVRERIESRSFPFSPIVMLKRVIPYPWYSYFFLFPHRSALKKPMRTK